MPLPYLPPLHVALLLMDLVRLLGISMTFLPKWTMPRVMQPIQRRRCTHCWLLGNPHSPSPVALRTLRNSHVQGPARISCTLLMSLCNIYAPWNVQCVSQLCEKKDIQVPAADSAVGVHPIGWRKPFKCTPSVLAISVGVCV